MFSMNQEIVVEKRKQSFLDTLFYPEERYVAFITQDHKRLNAAFYGTTMEEARKEAEYYCKHYLQPDHLG